MPIFSRSLEPIKRPLQIPLIQRHHQNRSSFFHVSSTLVNTLAKKHRKQPQNSTKKQLHCPSYPSNSFILAEKNSASQNRRSLFPALQPFLLSVFGFRSGSRRSTRSYAEFTEGMGTSMGQSTSKTTGRRASLGADSSGFLMRFFCGLDSGF